MSKPNSSTLPEGRGVRVHAQTQTHMSKRTVEKHVGKIPTSNDSKALWEIKLATSLMGDDENAYRLLWGQWCVSVCSTFLWVNTLRLTAHLKQTITLSVRGEYIHIAVPLWLLRVLCRMAVGTFCTTPCAIMRSVNLKHGCVVSSIEKLDDKMEMVDLHVAAVPTQSLTVQVS